MLSHRAIGLWASCEIEALDCVRQCRKLAGHSASVFTQRVVFERLLVEGESPGLRVDRDLDCIPAALHHASIERVPLKAGNERQGTLVDGDLQALSLRGDDLTAPVRQGRPDISGEG